MEILSTSSVRSGFTASFKPTSLPGSFLDNGFVALASGQWLQLPAVQKEDGSSIPLFSDDARNLLNKLMHLGALTLAFSGQVVKFLARTEKELCHRTRILRTDHARLYR